MMSAFHYEPFKPLWFSLNVVFLPAIVLATMVHEECCHFWLDDAGLVVRPNLAFHPKICLNPKPVNINPFHPHQEARLSGQSLLCAHRTTEQLLVHYKPYGLSGQSRDFVLSLDFGCNPTGVHAPDSLNVGWAQCSITQSDDLLFQS